MIGNFFAGVTMIKYYERILTSKIGARKDTLRNIVLKSSVNIFFAVIFFGVIFSQAALADTPVSLLESFAGNINITGTAGTLRTAPDGTNACSVTNSGSMTLSGIPAGSTIVKAYLYWAGSGGDPQGGAPVDYSVTFNGVNITADRQYTASRNIEENNTIYYFQGVKDVTSMVTGNGTYTFSNLTVQSANVNNGGQYCAGNGVLSAFSLVVIYSNPNESMHVVNLWEGFEVYWGSAITLSPSNFTVPNPVPPSAYTGRHLVLTWEGDYGNSQERNGQNEALTFCAPAPCTGTALTDGTINPANNQFNSTVDAQPTGPFLGPDVTWGADLDIYDITGRLHAGDSSARAVYSSGQDLVLLANQTMSIPNIPVSNLSITKTHTGNFTAGTTGSYTITVPNAGPSATSQPITVTDTLPAGLTFISGTGTGWSCSAAGQIVTCVLQASVASGATAPPLTINVAVGAAASSVTNTATVSGGNFDNVSSNNTASDVTTVLSPNLSTSTKTWQDLNGGDQNPGDVIRYTITITETAGIAASGVSVTDSIAPYFNSLNVVSIPAGAANSSTSNMLNITGINVPANGSVTIVFDVTIAGGTAVGTNIPNTAAIANPYGTGASPASSSITVSASSVPSTGNKKLYLWRDGSTTGHLYRSSQSVTSNYVTVAKNGTVVSWSLNPVLQSAVTINSGGATIPVQLWLSGYGYGLDNTYSIPVTLRCGTTQVSTVTRSVNLSGTATLFTFNLPAATATCASGSFWRLDIQNNRGGLGDLLNTADLRVYPAPSAGNYSNINLPSQNVINVDSIGFYNASYSGGTAITSAAPGQTIYIRATVSDPFGAYDITGATITLTDPSGSVRVNAAAMTQTSYSNAAAKIYEYAYTVPSGGGSLGYWQVRVVANEGSEGTVSDYGLATLPVVIANLSIIKSADKTTAVSGDIITYTIAVTNNGTGPATNVVIDDSLSQYTQWGLSSYSGVAFQFVNGSPSSGLTLGTPVYSNNNGSTWSYVPSSGGGGAPAGYDGSVTNWRIPMNGSMNSNGANFTINYKVRVK